MAKVKGTNVDLVFVEKSDTDYAAIYYSGGQSGPALASVNAGNAQQLYVGGGGINAGFAHALRAQKIGEYATRHVALAAKAAQAGGEAFERYSDDDPMAFSYAYTAGRLPPSAYEGVCFVDVFAARLAPGGNASNAAMLYVAPPDGSGHPQEADFLGVIKKTGRSIAEALTRYNALAAGQSMPVLPALRCCLYSSAIYNPQGVSLNKIALAIYEGLATGLAADATGVTELQLPYANPLFLAVKEEVGG